LLLLPFKFLSFSQNDKVIDQNEGILNKREE
jgi:hypothetical protein